jgi:hypothetical protein
MTDAAQQEGSITRATALPDTRRRHGTSTTHCRDDDGMRGERACPARATAPQPALARGGRRHRLVDRRPPGAAARGGGRHRRRDQAVFAGLDEGIEGETPQRYERSVPLGDCLNPDVLLAYEMNGAPLPPQHGYPLRLVVPGWYGMTNVKWLTAVRGRRARRTVDPDVAARPDGAAGGPGVHDPRRFVTAGRRLVKGRAWSGWGPVTAVDVSTDGGQHWAPARLDAPPDDSPWAWRLAVGLGRRRAR